MNQTLKELLWPIIWVRRKHDNYLKKTNPEKLYSIYHKRSTGKHLNIDHPITLNEKIAYMAFRTDTSEWSRLTDKVKVREYVVESGYADHLPVLYGVWEKADGINFSMLPESFVIKTNNASATNILVKNKKIINQEKIRKQLENWLKIDYGYETCQPHYSKIKSLVLAEEFLIDNDTNKKGKLINDYKFYCVNGSPMFVFIYTDRAPNSHDMKRTIYDMNWNIHQEYLGREAVPGPEISKPISFDLMKEMACKLATPFPFVRVDFYEINGKPVFGEMTFTPGMQEASNSFLTLLGDKVRL